MKIAVWALRVVTGYTSLISREMVQPIMLSLVGHRTVKGSMHSKSWVHYSNIVLYLGCFLWNFMLKAICMVHFLN